MFRAIIATMLLSASSAHAGEVTEARPDSPWVVGSEWTFVVGDRDETRQTYVVRVTDRPMGNSDRWFMLDAVADPRESWTSYIIHPDGTRTASESRFSLAAARDGRHLEVDLAARVKDVGLRIVGELDGPRFAGELRRSNIFDGESTGPGVVGWRSGSRPDAPPEARGWVVGSEWTFVVPGADGQKQTFVFRVTDCRYVPSLDCDRMLPGQPASDYRRLEILADPRPPLDSHTYLGDGAFEHVVLPHDVTALLQGRRLSVNLLTGTKDAWDELVGEIEGERFLGVRRSVEGLGHDWVETPGVEGWRSR